MIQIRRFQPALAGILFLLLLTVPDLSAQSYITESGYAEFESSAPLLTFKGKSNRLTGLIDLEENLVDFYLDLNTLKTGISRRDRDMRTQYLETDKYPFAEFTGTITSDFDPELRETQEVTVEGTFTIHGVERDIIVSGTLTPRESGQLGLEANWTVMLEDHNIDRPGILFYELAEEQKVMISATLQPRKE